MFHQSALIGRGKRGQAGETDMGHIYAKGVHALVNEKHLEDQTFKHYLKHKLITEFVPSEQKDLKPASSEFSKVSMSVAKSQLEPDVEIGGDEEKAPKRKKGK